MSPKRKAKWINGEKMIIADVIFRWVQLIQKQCWENIHIHIIAGGAIRRRPASFSGVRLMNEPTHWPRQTPRRARNAHPSIHPPYCHPFRSHFIRWKTHEAPPQSMQSTYSRVRRICLPAGTGYSHRQRRENPTDSSSRPTNQICTLSFFMRININILLVFTPQKKAAWRNKLSPLLILMEYGFTGICDECVVKSSTGRTLDYIWLKEFGGKVEWHH